MNAEVDVAEIVLATFFEGALLTSTSAGMLVSILTGEFPSIVPTAGAAVFFVTEAPLTLISDPNTTRIPMIATGRTKYVVPGAIVNVNECFNPEVPYIPVGYP